MRFYAVSFGLYLKEDLEELASWRSADFPKVGYIQNSWSRRGTPVTTIASSSRLGTRKSLGLSHSHSCWGSYLSCLWIFHYPDIITVHLTGQDTSLPALSVQTHFSFEGFLFAYTTSLFDHISYFWSSMFWISDIHFFWHFHVLFLSCVYASCQHFILAVLWILY